VRLALGDPLGYACCVCAAAVTRKEGITPMASRLDPGARTESPECGPTGHHLGVLLVIAADPGSPIAAIAQDLGLSPEALDAVVDALVVDGYLVRTWVDGEERLRLDEEAPITACGWCPGGRLGDVLALARLWSDAGDALGFSRAVERLAWGSPRPR
jgi:hypothetical protein